MADVVRQQAAHRATDKQAQRLRSIIHAHRRALGLGRRELGNQRGQAGFENIEGDEEQQQHRHDAPEILDQCRQQQLRHQQQRDGKNEYLLQLGFFLADR